MTNFTVELTILVYEKNKIEYPKHDAFAGRPLTESASLANLRSYGHTLLWTCDEASKNGRIYDQLMRVTRESGTDGRAYRRMERKRTEIPFFSRNRGNRCVLVRGYFEPSLHIVVEFSKF